MLCFPYLTFTNQCEEAFNFYAKAFKGKVSLTRFADGGFPIDEQHKNLIMNAELKAGNAVFMGSDCMPGDSPTVGNNVSATMVFDTAQQAEEAYAIIKEGATIIMEMAEQPWAERYSLLKDKYNVTWSVMGGMKE